MTYSPWMPCVSSVSVSIQAMHSGYLFMEQAENDFLKNAGNYTKRRGLTRWSFFPIEWSHNIVFLIGRQSKYCRGFLDMKTGKMRRDALIIFPIAWHHNIVMSIGKRSKYCRELFDIKAEKMRPDALTSQDDHFEG